MKKKVFLTLFALCFALCCAVGLTACDGGDTGVDNRIYLVRSNGTALDSGGELGEFTYLVIEEFNKVFDIKVCTKNADGTFSDVDINDCTVTYYDILKDGAKMDPQPEGHCDDFLPGYYRVEVKYNDEKASAYFTVKKSKNINYTATVSKTGWKFGEEGATLTVSGVTEFTGYSITEDVYNEIKDAEDLAEKLANCSRSTYGNDGNEDWRYLTPGKYYLFAYCYETKTHEGGYTDLKQVEVYKGDLTIKNADSISVNPYSYRNGDKIGDIKLSDITINDHIDFDYENAAYAEDAFGHKVYGKFVWETPDKNINSTDSGSKFAVKFVANDDYYNEKTNVAKVEITVYKGYVKKPHKNDENKYVYEQNYDGEEHEVYVSATKYDKYVTATRNGDEMQIETGEYSYAILETVTDVGPYVYSLSLKDKTNFYWVEQDDDPNEVAQTDTADIIYTYRILPRASYARFYNAPQLIPDNNGVIMLEVAPYLSPYVAGTLTAIFDCGEVGDPDYVSDPKYTGTAEIVTEDGVDYLKLSNIVVNEGDSSYTNCLPIKFVATGADNYADIYDWSHDIRPSFSVGCDVPNLTIYKTTTAQILYDTYPTLNTPFGEYTLQMQTGTDSWMTIGKEATLPAIGVEYNFRLVLDYDKSKLDPSVTFKQTINFTITGIDVDCPIEANTQIEATAGTLIADALQGYPLTDDYGTWFIQSEIYDDVWQTIYYGGDTVVEGATTYRLLYLSSSVYGGPDPVEFTVVGTAD